MKLPVDPASLPAASSIKFVVSPDRRRVYVILYGRDGQGEAKGTPRMQFSITQGDLNSFVAHVHRAFVGLT
jgi:hypothetical protein